MECSPHCFDSPNHALICYILVRCSRHGEDRSPQMSTKTNPPTRFPPLPVRVQAVSRTSKACRVHSWRLTIHTHRVALSEILHPSGQGLVFRGTVVSQWLCLELHTVSRAKKKKKKEQFHLLLIRNGLMLEKGLGSLELPEDTGQPGEGRALHGHRSQNALSSFSFAELWCLTDNWTFLLFFSPRVNYLVNTNLQKLVSYSV